MRTDCARRRVRVVEVWIEGVTDHALANLDVDPPVELPEQLLPAHLAGAVGCTDIAEPRPEAFQVADPRVGRCIVTPEVAVGLARQALIKQTLFVARDLTGVDVADQPRVGVPAVV